MNLARLWQQQDRQNEARTLLFEIYNWFTEGFTTVDLRAAKSLLDSLAISPPDQDAELERRDFLAPRR